RCGDDRRGEKRIERGAFGKGVGEAQSGVGAAGAARETRGAGEVCADGAVGVAGGCDELMIPYIVRYAPNIKAHLNAIDKRHHSLIRKKIEEQLRYEPGVETKNRKQLRQPAGWDAEWEIRFGPNNTFRVLYDIDEGPHEVVIKAVGIK